jgi:DNA-binding transcriptional ArsR family regulator
MRIWREKPKIANWKGPAKCLDGKRFILIVKYMLNYQVSLDLAFQALADPARRAIVERLAQGPASVSDLARPLPMSLPAVMLHLKVLEEAGLIKSEKQGRVRTCRIEAQNLSQAERWIGERRQMWERNLDRLGEFLDQTKEDPT